jgi:Fe-S-cluster containining protein
MDEGRFNDALRRAVQDAATRPEVADAVAAVYDDLAAEVAARRPRCELSGRCCRFEEYGHRLYVTTIELAAFVRAAGERKVTQWDGRGCPFQVDKLCGVHGIRPFGCRIFFCDPLSTDWQREAYERFHGRLKRLHDELAVAYFYVEWRQALAEVIGVTPTPVEPRTPL